MTTILDGLRVVDRTTQIAGPYCTKLLADAGADVVKVETPAGDPLRRWRSGGLFEYLNASKRSITDDDDELVRAADILVAETPVDLAALWEHNPALVVVTITPFGTDGPWAARPATEFTLQAASGSTGNRGLPEEPPLAAGGRLGEWISGTYAAVGALGAWLSAERSGEGEHVDVAMLDCMTVTMASYPSVFADFAGWPPQQGTGRSIEIPSIEPTADGFVVFTTNSAQQFQDFLVLIGHPELIADTKLARAMARFERRDEFIPVVRQHTEKHTSEELLEAAGLLRIPCGPVLNGRTVATFPQFVERGVFRMSPSGRFRQPRVPYRISGAESRDPLPAPGIGADNGRIDWRPRTPTPPIASWRRPLDGVRVLDCTAWWAGPAASHVLAGLGADVIKVESVTRPDLMRYMSVKRPTVDQWWEWGPLFHAVNVEKRGITIDLNNALGLGLFRRLLTTADVLFENYTPRVMEHFGLGWPQVHEVNPDLCMVRMPAFGLDGPWRDRTGFAQTMEGVCGMAWMTGFEEGPPVLVRGACDPLAGLHAVLATMFSLLERRRRGGGRLVEVTMVEAALNAAAEQIIEADASATLLTRAGNRGAAAPQGVYQCSGDDQWVALAVRDDAEWAALRSLVDLPEWTAGLSGEGRRAEHDRIDLALADALRDRDAGRVAEALSGAGVPCEVVIAGRDVVHNPQLRHRGLFEIEDHPITGPRAIPSIPLRWRHVDRWATRPSPTVGQHNDEVLGTVASPEELAALRSAGVIGERVAGA